MRQYQASGDGAASKKPRSEPGAAEMETGA